MFRLDQIGPTRGDCTALYAVTLDKEYTVAEFVRTVVSRTDEWGYIRISGGPSCEYRWGKLLSTLPEEVQEKKVLSVKADGGWTAMDYKLVIEEEQACSTEKRNTLVSSSTD